jgi:hypothetical protein
MTRHDWLTVGFKLLGVYFGVLGLSALWQTFVTMILSASHVGIGIGMGFLQPLVYILSALILTLCTEQCLRWCGETRRMLPS